MLLSDIGGRFNGPPGDRAGGWWILYEPELHLGDDILVPDCAGWRRNRTRKMRVYAREGIGHLWFVDPIAQTLEVYRLDADGLWIVVDNYGGDDVARAEPFDAIEVDLARWWLPAA